MHGRETFAATLEDRVRKPDVNTILHIIGGDCAGSSLAESGIPGEILVWRDILYEGSREPGWPDESVLDARAKFLEHTTGGGLRRDEILATLRRQYCQLAEAGNFERVVLWFDACLFDQSMLVHILACMQCRQISNAELICVDRFPGIVPFHGLGQLQPDQLASLYDRTRPVTDVQFEFARIADRAFALRDLELIGELSRKVAPPIPWIPAAAERWIQEQPDPVSGLERLESLILEALRNDCVKPGEIFSFVADEDNPPQFWGDTTLWRRINGLAQREPPLVKINGPAEKLPQWESTMDLDSFRINPNVS